MNRIGDRCLASFRGVELAVADVEFLGARWGAQASAISFDAGEVSALESKSALRPVTHQVALEHRDRVSHRRHDLITSFWVDAGQDDDVLRGCSRVKCGRFSLLGIGAGPASSVFVR
ncbi:MAG: hypothetical protein ACREM1_12475 [Longimicrobiales bacterium]